MRDPTPLKVNGFLTTQERHQLALLKIPSGHLADKPGPSKTRTCTCKRAYVPQADSRWPCYVTPPAPSVCEYSKEKPQKPLESGAFVFVVSTVKDATMAGSAFAICSPRCYTLSSMGEGREQVFFRQNQVDGRDKERLESVESPRAPRSRVDTMKGWTGVYPIVHLFNGV
jgi:hypothetical protein